MQCKVSKEHVTKALGELLKKGKIVESCGAYALTESSSTDPAKHAAEEKTVPYAEILRRRAGQEKPDRTESENEKQEQEEDFDIDEEIRRLEAELAADDDESDEESKEASDDDVCLERDKRVSFGKDRVKEIEPSTPEIKDTPGDAVVCFSTVAEDRIAPLPANCLPQTKKRILKGIDDVDDPLQNKPKKPKVSNGLRDAVKEVLHGYVARSSERLPFYCRVCAKQYTNDKEFFDHKSTDFHKSAVEVERKTSFCKLCRKQFTSPVQLKEHISSRPHKERLDQVRSRQSHSKHAGFQSRANDHSRRQWC